LTEEANFPVALMCKVLDVSKSGYYRWLNRKPSVHEIEDVKLLVEIRTIYQENREVYGSPKVWDEFKDQGRKVGRRRVSRLMRENGIVGVPAKKRFHKTTDSGHNYPIARNLVRRHFSPSGPDILWAGDITYVRTWEDWLHVAVVIDLFSRKVVGWAMAEHMKPELPMAALEMSLGIRGTPDDLIFHSDRGIQYASDAYRELLGTRHIRLSMSRKGDCWDNAVSESFMSILKRELTERYSWPTIRSAKEAIADYIEGFYNSRRKHSFNGYLSPNQYEECFSMEKIA
jgi:putative transposase